MTQALKAIAKFLAANLAADIGVRLLRFAILKIKKRKTPNADKRQDDK